LRVRLGILVVAIAAACGCRGNSGPADAGSGDAQTVGTPAADAGELRYLERLTTAGEMAALQGRQGDVKYLFKVDGQTPPLPQECLFQNSALYPYHLDFLHIFPDLADLSMDAYKSLVLIDGRVWWGGSMRAWPAVTHPLTGQPGIVSYSVYTEVAAGPPFDVADIAEVDRKVKACAPFAATLLAFVPTAADQVQRAQDLLADLTAAGVAVVLPGQLIAGLPSVSYSLGEGYGYLDIVARGQPLVSYGPRDVVVVESAPNDISIVAGLVSANPQSPASHTNLRLQEKGIPSAAVPAIYADASVARLGGSLVHVVVGASTVIIEPALLADAEAFWASHHPKVPAPVSDLSVTQLKGFDVLRSADTPAFGVKTSNLGELHALLAADNRVEGFGIPFSRYREHLAVNGLDAAVTATLANSCLPIDALCKRKVLDDLHDRIRDAPLDAAFAATLEAKLREVFGAGVDTLPLRLRSSTNVEDLDVFTGAGLYDSARGCLADDLDGDELGPSKCLGAEEKADMQARLAARKAEYAAHPERSWFPAIIDDLEGDLTKERTVARAVRKVWASLWNEAAFDERAYFGIDQTAALMGMAVEPTFVLERAEAVAFTALDDGQGGATLYRVVSQADGESAVEPADPTLVAEVLTFHRAGSAVSAAKVLVYSTSSPAASLWSAPDLDTLGALLFSVHDHFTTAVYPALAHPSLDIEVKLAHDGKVVVKQVRPYVLP
jgi:pyruvate, water dikinase